MKVTMDVNFEKFHKKCEAAISKVAQSTKWATEEAALEIMVDSLNQVPMDTETLASGAFYEVKKAPDYGFEAVVGYKGDKINPKSGKPVSDYMVMVHEDLTANHPIGKAKFLEDPIRAYADDKFPRTVIKHVKAVLDGESNE